MHIEYDKPLAPLTTFKIGGPAREFTRIESADDLPLALQHADEFGLSVLILGGGSNMLISDSGFDGLVIQIANGGIEVSAGDDTHTILRVASGEVWDDVVKYSVDHNLWGIENLSRIPGQAGSVAVQNVGAYGEEARDVIVNVEVFDRKKHKFRTLTNEECMFRYRSSIFNSTEKDRYVILNTTFRLSTIPKRNLSYPDVRKRFEANPEPRQQEIREAIKEIRDRKFPFPAESVEGNAGSFFKNSVITYEERQKLEWQFEYQLPDYFERLNEILSKVPSQKAMYPWWGMPVYAAGPYKIPSAFILEACGLNGFRMGDVMLNPTQPVVVLNVTGKASASDVLTLVREVRKIVQHKTGLHLLTEPELIGFDADELSEYGFVEGEIERYVPS